MHIFPQLRKLEEKYKNELIVIGVHSGKFQTEKSTEHIRQAVLRHGIRHAVINDHDFRVWRTYQVQAWPTVVLIDPLGRYLGSQPGELTFEQFDPLIRDLVRMFKKQLDRTPVSLRLETLSPSALQFPGKVLADSAKQRIFISDSGQHRIVVCDETGRQTFTVGTGEPGLRDGEFQEAQFQFPQGLACAQETVYVADTENHCIRAIDLKKKSVTTVAGTGEKADYAGGSGSAQDQTPLRSPWDLVQQDGILFIAMAGSHQLFSYDIHNKTLAVFAGNGAERLRDGALHSASFNQPSGLAVAGNHLYVADPEASAIRKVELAQKTVATLVGTGLFDFGDKDGTGKKAVLQHPLAVALHGNLLYIADTFNHKIKTLDISTLEVVTVFGNGTPALQDGRGLDCSFNEPSGLSLAGNQLYVADTNNHAIRIINLSSQTVNTLRLRLS